jgi:hypothetical protein
MRRLLSFGLAICAISTAAVVLAPGIASADGSSCALEQLLPPPIGGAGQGVGTDNVTVRLADKEVTVPGVRIRVCETWYGDGDLTHIPQWITPRLVPGTCESSLFDPACFTVYVDVNGVIGYSHLTVYVTIAGQSQPPIEIPIPPVAGSRSICVLSVGYRTAPVHDCDGPSIDLGS